MALSTARMDELAWRFIRMIGIVVVAILSVVTVWLLRSESGEHAGAGWVILLGVAAGISGAILVFAAPLAARYAIWTRVLCVVGGVAGLAAGFARPAQLIADQGPLLWGLLVLGHASSAFLLGSMTVSWILGHAYLTATKMTLAPLRRFSTLVIWSLVGRAAFVGVSVLAAWLAGSRFIAAVEASPFLWIVVGLRVGVGLIGVGVFALMVRGCVCVRATQSATGILYFGTLLAYIGEMAGQRMTFEGGWPF